MRLLIVDDDPSLRTALRLVFEDAGHEVFLAPDLDHARAQLVGVAVDGVLIDAGIDEGGLAFWEEMEADPTSRGKSMLLTGDVAALGSLKDHPRVFAKPFDYGLLLAQLTRMEQPRTPDQRLSPPSSLTSSPST